MNDHIQTATAGGVLTIRMNRPEKKNAISRAMYAAMTEAMRAAEADEDVKVVLLAGLPGAFTAGNDLADFMAVASGGALPDEVRGFLEALVAAQKPLMAAVDGLAIGIGTTLLMHCDYAVASKASLFKTPFVDLGLTPEAASSLIAPHLMGHQRAFALLAMGEAFDAKTARDAGLVTEIVDADPEGVALARATALAKKPAEAVRIAKRLMRADPGAVRARIDEEIAIFSERLVSVEAKAAFAAFFKR